MTNDKRRPVFLDLTRIHLPITAVLSITHRLTGILLFLLIPPLVYMFDLSLANQQGYDRVVSLFDHWGTRLLFILLLWGFTHHLLAGIRYLLIDIDIGVGRESSRITAWCVIAGGIIVLFLSALLLL
jgi:succinate dehydrogenase / fumarate reductase cytochrome b subunit